MALHKILVKMVQYGTMTVEAETPDEAMQIAEDMDCSEIDYSADWDNDSYPEVVEIITDDDGKVFTCGNSSLSRGELESLPYPFNTDNITDETMQAIVNTIESEMTEWYQWKEDGTITEYKCNEHWWEVAEDVVREYGIPYREDLE